MSTQARRAGRNARGTRARSQRRPSFAQRYRSLILSAAGIILVGGLLGIAILQATGASDDAVSRPSTPLDEATLASLASVSPSVFQEVGTGSASNPPRAINGVALTEDGKPEILYVGAEFCPFCASERWALLLALSRFGTFSGLLESHSAADDVHPNTPTVSFFGSSYESPYLAFTPVEQYTNQRVGRGYEPLQELTSEQRSIVNRFNLGGGIPYLYLAGDYQLGGSQFSPSLLRGMTTAEIAAAVQDPSTPQSQAIVGSANVLTAAFCDLTGGEPGNVCQSPEVVAARSELR